MVFKKGELRILWPFYLDSLLSPMLYFYPAFLVVYFPMIGLSLFQTGLLVAVPALSALLFEIPTGGVADLYGRKFSVIFGALFTGLFFFLMFFTTDFYLLLLFSALVGFFGTFSSGAHEAWVTDLLRKEDKGLIHDYFVKSNSFDSAGLVFSGIIGALLVSVFGTRVIFPVAGLSFLLSFLILAFGKERHVRSKTSIISTFKDLRTQTKKSVSYSRKHPVIFYFMIASFILVFAMAFNEGLTWTPFLQGFGFPDHAFGYLWSAISLVMVLSPWVSKKFMKPRRERIFVVVAVALAAITTSLVLWVSNLYTALAVTILSLFFFTMRRPAARVLFHQFIPDKMRATIGSVEAMVLSVAAIVATPLAGLMVDIIGPRYSIFISAVLMIPGIIVFYRIKDAKK